MAGECCPHETQSFPEMEEGVMVVGIGDAGIKCFPQHGIVDHRPTAFPVALPGAAPKKIESEKKWK